MANGIQIVIGSDVQGALAGLTAVDVRTLQLQKSIGRLQNIIANTTSTKQLSSALDALGKRQSELNKIVNAAPAALTRTSTASNQATLALSNLGRVAQDAPFGFIGIANNLNPLLESFQRLKATTRTTGGALKALGSSLLGAGGIGFALSVASSLLIVFGDKLFGAGKKAKEANEEFKRVQEVLKSVSGTIQERSNVAGAGAADEIAKVRVLSGVILDQTKSYNERNNALLQLQKINKNYFGDISLEESSLKKLTGVVNEYSNALIAAEVVKAFGSDIAKLAVEGAKAINSYNSLGKELDSLNKKLEVTDKYIQDQGRQDNVKRLNPEYTRLQGKINDVNKALSTQGKLVSEISGASRVSREGFDNALNAALKFKPLDANAPLNVTPTDITIDSQLAEIIRLDKPLRVAATIDLRDVEILTSADLLKNPEDLRSNISKSLSNLVIAPRFDIDPKILERNKEIRAAMEQMQKDAEFVASAISGAFGQAFDRIAEGDNVFQAVGEALKQLVLDLIKAAIQALIFRAIISALPGGAALSGAGAAGGLAGLFGGFRAGGGPVSGGKAYVVGENGPEIFAPNVSGSIIPNGRIGGYRGGGSQSTGRSRTYIRGNNLVLAMARTNRSQVRLG
jgi:hypothetical protein